MFKKQVYVKPLSLDPESYWGVFEMSPIESFFDDWLRYGLSVAWYNFQVEWILSAKPS